jgi:hypothetical protein
MTTSHSLYTRNGVTPVNAVDSTTGKVTILLTDTNQKEFGMTSTGYEDIMFLVEYWDTCFSMPARYYHPVTVRIFN